MQVTPSTAHQPTPPFSFGLAEWLGLGAMGFGSLHILLDFGVGLGGGLASVAVLAFGWTMLTNGYPIVYCFPPCHVAAPLTDVAHVGSLACGLAAGVGAVWALWQRRLRPGWRLPAGAAALVLASIIALANAAPS